ncbi:MAG: CRISPR-associated protein Cas5 [Candidatus Caldarchaeum sp.]
MEPVLSVKVRAPVASFRRPLDHNYQRTLPMPPPTTLLGIAGAALGLSDWELWALTSPLRDVKVSVWMDAEPGRARDMWTVLKIKNAKIEARSPYFRELLFFTRYTLLYGGERAVLEQLEQAFRYPVYPLSLGREDELLLVEEIELGEAQPGAPRFQGTILPGDVRHIEGLRPILTPGAVFEPPVVEQLPLRFSVDAKGIRHPEDSVALSFLPLGVELEVPNVETRLWQGRAFSWVKQARQEGFSLGAGTS